MNDALAKHYLEDAISSFRAHKKQAEKALEQVKDDELFQTLDEESNSRAMQLASNMMSIYWPNKENESVLDARGRFAQKQYLHENKWQPTPEIEAALERAIFGITKDGEPKKGKKHSLRLV